MMDVGKFPSSLPYLSIGYEVNFNLPSALW
jgi:hypothetical protein